MTTVLKRIMCVDDDEDILEIVKMTLETIGNFEVHCMPNGIKALNNWQTINPDFIILDVMMPEMDGPTVLKTLRKNDKLNNVPIALMTARVQATEVLEYLHMGAAGVILKPFDPMNLPTQVIEIWEKFHANERSKFG